MDVSKVLQQLKNISSYKICDKYSCMTVWGGLKVLLALTWDSLHNCSGIHLLWVMIKHPKVMLVEIWCDATLYYSSYRSVCLGQCVCANLQCCVPFIALHADIHMCVKWRLPPSQRWWYRALWGEMLPCGQSFGAALLCSLCVGNHSVPSLLSLSQESGPAILASHLPLIKQPFIIWYWLRIVAVFLTLFPLQISTLGHIHPRQNSSADHVSLFAAAKLCSAWASLC